ncbi:MAG TPA: argininosuccinate lyase [bacterium]|nr:argininosuccinate lyase [bacterium]
MAQFLWSGKEELPDIVKEFTYSIEDDKNLFYYDILGGMAHTLTLYRGGIIDYDEAKSIIDGLYKLKDKNDINFSLYEDIHTAVEIELTALIGEPAKKLHTARSRNDQVSLDERLYLRDSLKEVLNLIRDLIKAFLDLAGVSLDIIVPGFTHLQPAQPVLISHHLLAYVEMLKRDFSRFYSLFPRLNECPLGSGALAGLDFPYDRFLVSEILRFDTPTNNSMDTVTDRDYLIEYIFNALLTSTHISRFGEEIVIWSNPLFGFVKISSGYTTGSSMMPQKRNPDVAELLRGSSGEFLGYLDLLLVTLKGLPLTYNRDLQMDKKVIFRASRSLHIILEVTRGLLENMELDREKICKNLNDEFLLATDLADFLVNRGIPFRDSHHIVRDVVFYCQENKKTFSQLSEEEWRKFNEEFLNLPDDFFSFDKAINRRDTYGGTGRSCVEYQLLLNRKWLEETRRLIDALPEVYMEDLVNMIGK